MGVDREGADGRSLVAGRLGTASGLESSSQGNQHSGSGLGMSTSFPDNQAPQR